MKTNPRSIKLANIIQQTLPKVIHLHTNPEIDGFITILNVEVSGDLAYANIYAQSIGDKKGYIKRLNSNSARLAHEVSKIIPLQKGISFRFLQDSASNILEKISDL